MSGSSDPPHQAGVLFGNLADLTIPGVVVELDAGEAERLGAFAEPALTAAMAWEANGDLDADDREVARPADYAGQIGRSIADQVRTGSATWQKPRPPGERFMPYNPASGAGYHAINAMLLMSRAESRGFSDARWMTRREALEAGGWVRQGETGTPVLYWTWQGLAPVRDAGGKPMTDQDGNQLRRMVRYECPRVWSAAVFNAEQIGGLAPAPDRPALAERERHERAGAILANAGVPILHGPGDRAFYRLAEDTITLPGRDRFPTGDRYFAAALHQLGHATGHPSRFGRDMAHPLGSDGYARQELRARIASLLLGDELGLGHHPGQHAADASNWIRVLQEDPREIFRAAADAEKIAGLVRGFAPERAWQTGQTMDHDSSEAEQGAPSDVQEEAGFAQVNVRLPVLIQETHPAMTASDDRTYLAVPYDEKDDAKALGAKWDRQAKAWYVPAGVELEAFQPWLPAMGQVHIAVDADPRAEFAQALREAGLQLDGAPQMDGRMHRVAVEGDHGRERSGAYVGHLDGKPAGFIQNFRTGLRNDWKATGQAVALGAQDRARMAAEAAQKRHERAAERERQYERTAQEVDAIWTAATPVEAHPYLAEKRVASHGLRQGDGRLLVPVQDADGKLWSLQHIGADGMKQFHKEGRVEGGHFVIGDVNRPGPLLIAEGYATAATVHELTGMPAIVAFNAGNLVPVAQTYRALFPDRAITIVGDNDHRREAEGKPNVGREKAEQAAAAIGGFVLLPHFAAQDTGSDWNDLTRSEGRDEAWQQLRVALAVAEREQIAQGLAAERDRDEGQGRSSAATRDLEKAMVLER
jgi:antirestriction protein ArdC/phage/plasmid primase-like uncharacterized protein